MDLWLIAAIGLLMVSSWVAGWLMSFYWYSKDRLSKWVER